MRVGLIGFPVRHSISPVFQQAAFDALGIDARYELWETLPERLEEVVTSLRRPDCLGANVTIPHKLAIIRFLDGVDEAAAAIGSVNTIVRNRAGRLDGFNTDADGFARSIRDDGETDLEGSNVVVLGSGGAARAVVAAVIGHRAAELVIGARRPEQAESLLQELSRPGRVAIRTVTSVVPLDDKDGSLEGAVGGCDVLVNATPVGMARHGTAREPLLIRPEWLRSTTLVCDLVYNPPLTPLLEAARDRGIRVLNGLPMLVYQGAAAFERWTGQTAPVDLMRQKAREALHA